MWLHKRMRGENADHDVVTLEDIEEIFNNDISYIVDGVTKLGHIENYTHDELQAENHRKILV